MVNCRFDLRPQLTSNIQTCYNIFETLKLKSFVFIVLPKFIQVWALWSPRLIGQHCKHNTLFFFAYNNNKPLISFPFDNSYLVFKNKFCKIFILFFGLLERYEDVGLIWYTDKCHNYLSTPLINFNSCFVSPAIAGSTRLTQHVPKAANVEIKIFNKHISLKTSSNAGRFAN